MTGDTCTKNSSSVKNPKDVALKSSGKEITNGGAYMGDTEVVTELGSMQEADLDC